MTHGVVHTILVSIIFFFGFIATIAMLLGVAGIFSPDERGPKPTPKKRYIQILQAGTGLMAMVALACYFARA